MTFSDRIKAACEIFWHDKVREYQLKQKYDRNYERIDEYTDEQCALLANGASDENVRLQPILNALAAVCSSAEQISLHDEGCDWSGEHEDYCCQNKTLRAALAAVDEQLKKMEGG